MYSTEETCKIPNHIVDSVIAWLELAYAHQKTRPLPNQNSGLLALSWRHCLFIHHPLCNFFLCCVVVSQSVETNVPQRGCGAAFRQVLPRVSGTSVSVLRLRAVTSDLIGWRERESL